MNTKQMKIEIWSDIMCPFCYIGKRHFETAIQKFDHAADIEVEWKSFQLDPSLPAGVSKNIYTYLAEKKGITEATSRQMHAQVTTMAKQAGLNYQFDKAIVANSFHAHRLIQLAKQYALGDAAEEALFKAYFEEGKNLGDQAVLETIGEAIGLPVQEVKHFLNTNAGAAAVQQDIAEAQQMGVSGVPFFVFNRQYAVSGAQPVDHFLQALKKSFSEWQAQQPQLTLLKSEGAVCDTATGNCNE